MRKHTLKADSRDTASEPAAPDAAALVPAARVASALGGSASLTGQRAPGDHRTATLGDPARGKRPGRLFSDDRDDRARTYRRESEEWLEYEGANANVLLTLTYANEVPTPAQAEKDGYRFLERMDRLLGFAPLFVGCVEGDASAIGTVPRTHLHALLGGVQRARCKQVGDLWTLGIVNVRQALSGHLRYVLKSLPDHGILLLPGNRNSRVRLHRRRLAWERRTGRA